MTVPEFTEDGLLPPGIHDATWEEFAERFGHTGHRRALLRGLKRACASLKQAGCKRVYVDGSYVTSKPHPNDFDACWDEAGVDPSKLDPVLLKFDNKRAAQKALYGGELFPASSHAALQGSPFLGFFQTDRATGTRKGIVCIKLTEPTP